MPFFGTELFDKIPSKTIENPVLISDHILKRRKELNLRQSDLAELIGVCTETITAWEKGRSYPYIQHYPKLITFLGYNPFPVADDSTFSGKIKNYRMKFGLSQKKLAQRWKVDEATINSWELSRHIPLPSNQRTIEELMNQIKKGP